MTEDNIRSLIKGVDDLAGPPRHGRPDVAMIRLRARRRQRVRVGVSLAAVGVLALGLGLLVLSNGIGKSKVEEQKIASLESQVTQLQARMDSAFGLIHEVLEQERQERRLGALEAQLASIPDPVEKLDRQVDRTAFILVYQADRLYRELNRTDSAVEMYRRVINLFPGNRWAQVARERLSEIERKKI